MSTTADITKAARTLASAERRLEKVRKAEDAFIEKARAKAQTKYAEKIQYATSAVAVAKASLQALVNAA